MFTDRVRLRMVAGKGGNGIISWRREKYIPKGGPTGGNGGQGGSVRLRVDSRLRSLERYRYRRVLRAENGRAGGPNRCNGRRGTDLILDLPPGTLIKDAETGQVLRDLKENGEEWRICGGGRGGRGNASFKSPTHRAPAVCTPGLAGAETLVELELKLIADVGLVGFPNAGKSTFVRNTTRLPAKTAPYPFTTLTPSIGTVTFPDQQQLLIADIPGIIDGASHNRGLGLDFLRHIERTRVLLFVLDGSGIDGRNPLDDYKVLRQELAAYDPTLLTRPYLVAFNKCDTPEARTNLRLFQKAHPVPMDLLFPISAQDGTGLEKIIAHLRQAVLS